MLVASMLLIHAFYEFAPNDKVPIYRNFCDIKRLENGQNLCYNKHRPVAGYRLHRHSSIAICSPQVCFHRGANSSFSACRSNCRPMTFTIGVSLRDAGTADCPPRV